MTKPFRFGVQLGGAIGLRVRDKRAIEDLGYSTLFMPDHFEKSSCRYPDRDGGRGHHDAEDRRVVFDNDYKHPATLRRNGRRSICSPTGGSSSASARAG